MFITPERCQRVIFSDPHFCIEQAFLVQGRNPGGGAFAFRQEDTDLRDGFNQALRDLRDDGTLTKSVTPFGFLEASEQASQETASSLCEP